MRFQYVYHHAKTDEIATYCRALEISPQGYKKYLLAQQKPYKYAHLLADMGAILEEDIFNQTYGKVRMYEKLQLDFDCPYCYNTVAKVMREHGLLQQQNRPKGLTKADKNAQKSDDLFHRDFTADAPNQKIVTDITEVACADDKFYVSGIFDCFDTTCLGVAIDYHMKTELVIESYEHARKQHNLAGSITHSDRGSQYTSQLFRDKLAQWGITQSMNSAAGRCHDNAKCESMWARMKSEIFAIYNPKKMTCAEMIPIIYNYFTDYWNNRRICSAIGGVPPAVKRGAYFEKLLDQAA